MRFGILGPLEVWHDGHRLSVGGPQQRALLAALLLNANRVVSTDRLVTYLWGDQPPAAARSLVQGCVAQLRRVFKAADPTGRRLVTRPPGYLLELAPDELDLDRFEALVAGAARRSAAQAAEALGAALSLWRGPALDGVDVEAARTDATRLEERRLAIVEQRLEADLRLGHYATLAADLEAQVRVHPLRERLWALLMLAQYGADRQADALATYQRLRRTLVDELGVEPSQSLRQLQATILAGDDALAPYRAAPVVAPRTVPAQLPPAVAGFTGRDEHLKALDELLSATDGEATIGVVSGTAGVGKTALAVHWGHRVRDQFPDGQLYVNLQGYAPAPPTRPIDALAGFLQSLGTPAEQVPDDVHRATAQYRSLVAGRRMLVVLDNAQSADQVRPLLPGGTGCVVLVTSRDRLGGLVARDGARPLALDVLPSGDAVALLVRVLGPERAAAESAHVADLARLCAQLPLALRIAAANLACQPHRRIADEVAALSSVGDRLSTLEVPGDEQTAVRAAFDLSYSDLTAADRLLFRRLGLVPGPEVTVAAAAALCAIPETEAAPALERLVRANLIQAVSGDRFAFHDLLRLYAGERAARDDAAAERAGAVGRLYDRYLSSCEAAARALYPGKLRLPAPDPPSTFDSPGVAAAWLDDERANLVAATLYAAEHGPRPAAWRLADSLRGYLWLRMLTVDWQPVAAAGLAAATAAGDLAGQAAARLSLADVNRCQARFRAAIDHYTEAAALAERGGWYEGQSAALGNLGSAYFWLGDLPAAAEQYGRALDLARAEGREAAQAVRLGNLGLVNWLLGRFTVAADLQSQALALHRRLGARGNEGIDLANLAECQHALGNLELAHAHLTEALAIHTEVGDRGAEGETRGVLAAVERDAGRLGPALDHARTAVSITRDSGDRPVEANALNVLATVHHGLGQHVEAVARHGEALKLARETGTRYAELTALVGLAAATLALGDRPAALGYAEQALDQARDGGFRVVEGHAHAALAAVALDAGDLPAANRHARPARDIYRATGHRLGEKRLSALLAGR